MSATSEPFPAPSAWPAARLMGITPIQHPAWEEARNAILDHAAAGPATIILVGESGTGKTWLLRELASLLGEHGFPTMLLLQGDLPMALSPGAALLVDEASRMDPAVRADLLAQRHGVVVLAYLDTPELPPASEAGAGPAVIHLRPIEPGEIGPFVAEWLRRAPIPATVDAAALSRLAVLTGGTIRLIVQLLAAATTMTKLSGQPIISAAEIDDVAQLRLAGITEPAAASAPAPTTATVTPTVAPAPTPAAPPAATPIPPFVRAPRRSLRRPALAVAAIAASLVLGWALMPAPPTPAITAAAPPPKPPLPALADATPARPTPATAAPPGPAETRAPVLAAAPLPAQPAPPPLALADAAPLPAAAPSPPPLAAAAPTPASAPSSPAPVVAAALPPPARSPIEPAEPLIAAAQPGPDPVGPADQPSPRPHGGPGLVLVAQRGDTLQTLYGHIYRDRDAPAFATVLAANPGPFKPGAILVFPEPPGGWQRTQR